MQYWGKIVYHISLILNHIVAYLFYYTSLTKMAHLFCMCAAYMQHTCSICVRGCVCKRVFGTLHACGTLFCTLLHATAHYCTLFCTLSRTLFRTLSRTLFRTLQLAWTKKINIKKKREKLLSYAIPRAPDSFPRSICSLDYHESKLPINVLTCHLPEVDTLDFELGTFVLAVWYSTNWANKGKLLLERVWTCI